MDILRRAHAPFTQESWKVIDEQAREVLRANLSARTFVEVSGPHGWDYAAVNLGRLDPAKVDGEGGLFYGIRSVKPLVEIRVPFRLDLWELDNIARGAKDPNLDPMIEASMRAAAFEERAVYYGFEPAGIVGLAQASTHQPVTLSGDAGRYAERIAHAIVLLRRAGEGGPYTLIAGPRLFQLLEGEGAAYPPRKQIEALTGGPIRLSPIVEGGFLVPSDSHDDFELVLGQDFSVGYEVQDGGTVRLYITESFSFRVLEPQAVVALRYEG